MTSLPQVQAILPVRKSMRAWALLAIFMVGFSYVFTLALAAVCFYLPVLLIQAGFELNIIVILLSCWIAGILILISLIPRRDKFIAPGPELKREAQPRLFAEIERISVSLGEPMPEAVFLLPDVNAFVAQRGGWFGFGSRRVMGLGLPLMQLLTESELRAVLAHEFAHYYGGDTRLGPWVGRARDAMVRTLMMVSDVGEHSGRSIAGLIFWLISAALAGYWKVFLRLTQLVSRRQEFRADELACAIGGSAALMGGLRKVEGAESIQLTFLLGVMGPAIANGLRAPLAEGFARYWRLPKVAATVEEHVEKQIKEGTSDVNASHPPLRERLAAAEKLSAPGYPAGDGGAVALFENADALEVELIGRVFSGVDAAGLKRVAWDRIGDDYYLAGWSANIADHREVKIGMTAESWGASVADLRDIIAQMPDPKGRLFTREQRAERALSLLVAALSLALIRAGWELKTELMEYWLARGDDVLRPSEIVQEIRSGKTTAAVWAQRARDLGIASLSLQGATFAAGA